MNQTQETIRLSINKNEVIGKVKNYWNNVHFHPTDAIEDEWGQRILNKFAEDNIAQTVRLYTMFEDIVSMDSEGNLQYDFSLNDERIDYLLSKGFNIMLIYAYVPACLAIDPEEVSSMCKNKTRYKGKMIITSPPKSYTVWEEVCATYTAHIVERYGEETVAKWYLQCHNEPDASVFWMRDETDMDVCAKEYCKLYDAFEAGVRKVSTKLKIGGPVLAEHLDFMEYYLRHMRDTGRRMDFITFHTYGTHPNKLLSGERPFSVDNSVPYICKVQELAEHYGFADIPLVIDEWGASCHGFNNVEECPPLILREKPGFAAYFAKMITLYVELKFPIEVLMICLSGQHEMVTDFSGFRNMFTLNFYQKPIYNAFCLARKLGENLLTCRGNTDENLSVLPTIDSEGRAVILLSYASKHFDKVLPALTIELDLVGEEETVGELYRIDETHANAMHLYEQLGCPNQPTEEQKAIIRKGAVPVSEKITSSQGEPLQFTMENESVVLLHLN